MVKSLWAAVWRQPGVLWLAFFIGVEVKGGIKGWWCNGRILVGHLLGLFQKSHVEKEERKAAGACEWAVVVMHKLYVCSDPKPGGIGSGREIRQAPRAAFHWKPEVWQHRAIFILVRMCTRCMTCKLNWQQNTASGQWRQLRSEVTLKYLKVLLGNRFWMSVPLWLLEELYYSPQKTVGGIEISASIV